MSQEKEITKMEKLISLGKRRGFIFQSSEIYGGFGSCYDYGPLGVALANNIKKAWWQAMVQARDDIVGLDSAIIMHPKVWEASGHVESFSDPLVDCKQCKKRFRADHLLEVASMKPDLDARKEAPKSTKDIVCPECGYYGKKKILTTKTDKRIAKQLHDTKKAEAAKTKAAAVKQAKPTLPKAKPESKKNADSVRRSASYGGLM